MKKLASTYLILSAAWSSPAYCQSTETKKTTAWISENDYPAESIRAREEGDVTASWTIGTDGRVSDCKIVVSSGYPRLDQATCNAMTLKGRYSPALDQAGNPVASQSSRTFVWRLPH